ncbi:glycosyltransferase [uncultured Pseudodesulfovibrio sp.]|uniref:glycosyltransferase n=1 Tax=uncultured Pseudodesulfovibrio sp. TaxID=2035858 RepID=UPI0029C80EEA|nr:glycosyltransferase [uncultured Pseudodesulfovibrio sp.]
MRILNLDGHYFVKPFREMGHEVLWLGPDPGCDVRLETVISLADLMGILRERAFTPDLVVWNDICRPPSVIGIEALPAVTVGFSIDQYCNPWHMAYAAAFDLMLVAQKDYLPLFEQEQLGNELEWFPLFCNPERDTDQGLERDVPVSFVGTVEGSINTHRKLFLNAFKKHHPLFLMQGSYAPIFNRSRIVLNQSAVGELNFRVFEAMACGAALLTEDVDNGLKDLFTDGESVLLYPRGDAAGAAERARRALADGSVEAIAAQGHREVMAHHSSAIRAAHIVRRAKKLLGQGPTWRKRQQTVVRRRLTNAYNILATDEQLPLNQELRTFYQEIARITWDSAQ